MSARAERRITGDAYPGVGHPAVQHHQCPTCGAPRGEGCVVVRMRVSAIRTDQPHMGRLHTRTHRTRLNRWRMARQQRGAKR
jgi:hypothetical protein